MKNEKEILLVVGVVGTFAVAAILLYMANDSIQSGRHVMVSSSLVTVEFNRKC